MNAAPFTRWKSRSVFQAASRIFTTGRTARPSWELTGWGWRLPSGSSNKRGNRLKVLWFDHNGYCILYKRLHRAPFELPAATDLHRPIASIDPRTLGIILRGVEK